MITTNTTNMTRTEKINGFTISLEEVNSLRIVKIMPGMLMCRGKRNQETTYYENNSQDARNRVQAFKEYAKCNPL
jgi:hypothetical protein